MTVADAQSPSLPLLNGLTRCISVAAAALHDTERRRAPEWATSLPLHGAPDSGSSEGVTTPKGTGGVTSQLMATSKKPSCTPL